MIIDAGECVHMVTRRTFEGDVRRHFVGRVAVLEGSLLPRESDLEKVDYTFTAERRLVVSEDGKPLLDINELFGVGR